MNIKTINNLLKNCYRTKDMIAFETDKKHVYEIKKEEDTIAFLTVNNNKITKLDIRTARLYNEIFGVFWIDDLIPEKATIMLFSREYNLVRFEYFHDYLDIDDIHSNLTSLSDSNLKYRVKALKQQLNLCDDKNEKRKEISDNLIDAETRYHFMKEVYFEFLKDNPDYFKEEKDA